MDDSAESATTPPLSSGSEEQEEMESSQEPVARPQASTGPCAPTRTYTSSRNRKRTTLTPDNEELLAVLRSPVPKDDEDESFALSLVPELKKVVTNKGQLKLQVLSIMVNWEQRQQGAPSTPQPPSWTTLPRLDFHPPPASFHPTPPSLYSMPHDLPHGVSASSTSAAQSYNKGSWLSPFPRSPPRSFE